MREFFSVEQYVKKLENSESIIQCEKVPVPDIAENQNYIFISYAHRDYKRVYADLAMLYHAGVRFWYDRGLSAGKDWDAEVKEKILNPRCSGVIFYLSESLFLSKSANMEIDLVCGMDGNRKNYFCVNLFDGQPKDILKFIMRMDDTLVDNAGLDMERIGILARAFGDKQTYLYFYEAEHSQNLLEQIKEQFDVMEADTGKTGVLVRDNGEEIVINQDPFLIGKFTEKCHYIILDDSSISRMHASISLRGKTGVIMDLGAVNGTFVNETKLDRLVAFPLKEGDRVRLGNVGFVFRYR